MYLFISWVHGMLAAIVAYFLLMGAWRASNCVHSVIQQCSGRGGGGARTNERAQGGPRALSNACTDAAHI